MDIILELSEKEQFQLTCLLSQFDPLSIRIKNEVARQKHLIYVQNFEAGKTLERDVRIFLSENGGSVTKVPPSGSSSRPKHIGAVKKTKTERVREAVRKLSPKRRAELLDQLRKDISDANRK